jgi:hypothetical protein
VGKSCKRRVVVDLADHFGRDLSDT